MNHKREIHQHLHEAANVMLAYIEASESSFEERWVPATYIKDQLDLKIATYPRSNKIDNKTGWVFAGLARILEDEDRVEFKKTGNRSFYRSK